MTRILVVDDEWPILEVVCEVLQDEGYECVHADNGRKALAAAQAHRPDLVISDIMMPGMDGRELAEALGREPLLASVPVILMSAAERVKLDGTRAVRFLSKPFTTDRLLRAIRETLPPKPNGSTS